MEINYEIPLQAVTTNMPSQHSNIDIRIDIIMPYSKI